MDKDAAATANGKWEIGNDRGAMPGGGEIIRNRMEVGRHRSSTFSRWLGAKRSLFGMTMKLKQASYLLKPSGEPDEKIGKRRKGWEWWLLI